MTTTVGAGIGGSWGTAIEATWSTWLTPTKWLELDSETVEWKPKRIVGKGLYNGGLVQRNSQRAQTTATVQGDLKTGFYYKGMGQCVATLLGSQTTGAPAQQGATAAWLQTHALASNYGQSLSLQKGVPDLTGLIHQYNYNGCTINKAVFECGVDDYLRCTFSIDGHDYDTTNAYGAPSYQTGNGLFSFNQGQFCLGAFGSEVIIEGIRKWTLTIDRPMRVDNFYLDGTGRKQKQVPNGFTVITLDLESDYVSDAAFVAQFNTDTAQSMFMDFVGPQIAAGGGGAKTITAVSTAAGGAVVTSAAHGFTNGQQVVIASVTGTGGPSPNNSAAGNPAVWVVDSVATNTFRIRQNNTGFTYTSGGTATQAYYQLAEFQVPNLRWETGPPVIAGPDIVQPKLKLSGVFDDSHTAISAVIQSTDTTL